MLRRVLFLGLLVATACGMEAGRPAPTAAGRARAYAPPTLRLPAVARPRRYDLELTLDPAKVDYRGSIGADLDVLSPTDVIWLDATGLAVDHAQLVRAGVPPMPARIIPGGDDFIGFAFAAPIAMGAARLEVSFAGKMDPEKALGIYRQTEPDGQNYIHTFFEATDARRAFPCFDEPGYKVPWALTLHVKKEHVARANAKIASETPEANGMKAVRFEESRPLPSYLVAFVVGPFDVMEAADAGSHGTPLHFVMPPGHRAEARYAASITPKLVAVLEDYFGISYPYGKLDVAVNPRYWGTMEHPGLVAVGQPLTLMKEETTERKQRYATIAGHELAHYWFGDYVTMKWWDDTWLNESLASWMDLKVTSAIDPAWHFERERLARAESAMGSDELPSAKRVRQPVETTADIVNAFDGDLTYNKGGSLMAMLEGWLGPKPVQRATRAYLKAHAWGSASADDLFAAFDAELGPQASAMMRSFVDQPGLPLVHAELACSADERSVVLSQRRMVPQGMSLPDETWTVPVCVRYGDATGAAKRTCGVLASASMKLPLEGTTCPTWLMPNDDATGYYRAAYTRPILERLLATKGALRTTELASVASDADALVRTGALGIDDALAILPRTLTSSDRVVFGAAMPLFALAQRMADPAQAEKLAAFVRRTLTARAHSLGWTARIGEPFEDEEMRVHVLALWAEEGRDPQAWRDARGWAEKWLADRKALPSEVAAVALHGGARANDPAFFDAILAAARRSDERQEKELLFRALGAFTAPALVARANAVILGHDDDIHDTMASLFVQLGSVATHEAAIAFLDTSWDALVARLREDEAVWLFGELGTPCDAAREASLKRSFGPRATKLPGAERDLARSLERIRLCATIATTSRAKLSSFLDRH